MNFGRVWMFEELFELRWIVPCLCFVGIMANTTTTMVLPRFRKDFYVIIDIQKKDRCNFFFITQFVYCRWIDLIQIIQLWLYSLYVNYILLQSNFITVFFQVFQQITKFLQFSSQINFFTKNNINNNNGKMIWTVGHITDLTCDIILKNIKIHVISVISQLVIVLFIYSFIFQQLLKLHFFS